MPGTSPSPKLNLPCPSVISTIGFLLFLSACAPEKQHADLILQNGKVYAVDDTFGISQAFAIANGKILALGTNEDISNAYAAPETIDAHGKPVYPGFIDAHAHFVGYGRTLFEAQLYGCRSWKEVLDSVKAFSDTHPSETWIRGRGWDQNNFPGKAYPDNEALSLQYPNKPVLLQRVDGHAAIANNKALELAGIGSATKVSGGEITVKNGIPTGLLIDNAVDLVTSVIPGANRETYGKWLLTAQRNCFAQGLTTITDCGLKYRDVAMIDTLQREGKLLMRLYVMLSDDSATFASYWSARATALSSADKEIAACYVGNGPYKTARLYVRGVKAYADGALGSRGACLLQPYTDKPGWNGFLLSPQAHFDSLARWLFTTDMQLCTHAIGDSGNRMVLHTYARHLSSSGDKRWRVEHAQIVNSGDMAVFGKYRIIPSVQPTHATSDMYWAGERLGDQRLPEAYAYKQLLEQNGWLPLGTDFPVEDISPFKTFYAAVYRKDANGYPANGFQPENALTRQQALRGITIWAAKAAFMEQEIGSLEAGKNADFVILDRDLMSTSSDSIISTHVLHTYQNGVLVH